MDVDNVISQLEKQRSAIDRAIAALKEVTGPGAAQVEAVTRSAAKRGPQKRHMSAEGRKRIAEAARRRWAEKRASEGQSAPSPRKSRLSPEGRQRIIEATKKRWAAQRNAGNQKTAGRKGGAKKTAGRKAVAKQTA